MMLFKKYLTVLYFKKLCDRIIVFLYLLDQEAAMPEYEDLRVNLEYKERPVCVTH